MIHDCAVAAHLIASAAPEPMAPCVPPAETWYVATSTGTRAMTPEELDEALARGAVDTTTLVWLPGMASWEALGTVANLEDGPPLEGTPGKMLEYGLDAERASHSELHPIESDIRDYDPFSFPPPAENIPDPNRALWASILPVAAQPRPRSPLGAETGSKAMAAWMALVLSGAVVLGVSLLGIARVLSASSDLAPALTQRAALMPDPAPFQDEAPMAAPLPTAARSPASRERYAPANVVIESAAEHVDRGRRLVTSAGVRYHDASSERAAVRAHGGSAPRAKATSERKTTKRAPPKRRPRTKRH